MLEHKDVLRVHEELSRIARQSGLQWLLDDVARQIALGKESTKDIKVKSTVQGNYADFTPRRKGRPAKFVVTQSFSEREQLLLLIEAIEAASVGLSLGLSNAYSIIDEACQNYCALGFAPDTEGAEVRYVKSDVLLDKPAVEKLQRLLQELKEAV
jgi:hypothetical protein